MKNSDHLIEVKKNVFLNKKDPLFLKKYLNYYPDDKQANYEFARQLVHEGRLEQALQFLHKSARLGFLPAKNWLTELNEKQLQLKQQAAVIERTESLKRLGKRLSVIALIVSLILFLLLLLSHVGRESPPASASLYDAGSDRYFDQFFYFTNNKNVIHENEDVFAILRFLSVVSGLEYTYDAEGRYPSSLTDLSRSYPNNRMSDIFAGFSYMQDESKFSLYFEDRTKTNLVSQSSLPTHSDLLELHFYPEANQLVLSSGKDNPTVSFPVASGTEPLDFQESKVIHRVVDPKGFEGTFGTRGLALENNVAIHGTNQPELIGEYVSLGCIRMKNGDIESLYPFVPTGTPFIVKSGLPEVKPLIENGFPSEWIDEHADFFKGNPLEQSNQTYAWRR